MAEKDDDDEGFGDFKFASSFHPKGTIDFNQINLDLFSNDDEEWGDFVNHSSSQITAPVAQFELSNGFHRIQSSLEPSESFGIFFNESAKLSGSVPNRVEPESESNPGKVESVKKEWVKPQGALPLSIFGDVEEGSGVGNASTGDAADVFTAKSIDYVRSGSNLNAGLRIDDIIATLYNQSAKIKVENGSNSNSNELDSIGNTCDQSDQIKAENGSNSNANSHGFNWNSNGLISSSNGLDSIQNVYNQSDNQSEQIRAETGFNLPKWNSNGLKANMKGLDPDIVDGDEEDEDGWEFMGAISVSERGGENSKEEADSGLLGLKLEAATIDREIQADGDEQKNSEEQLHGFGKIAHSDLFATSNGFSYGSGELDIGFGFNPSTAVQNSFDSNSYLESKHSMTGNELNSHLTDGKVDSGETFWEFKDAVLETESKHEEEAEITDAGDDVSTLDGKIQVNKLRAENRKGALPLALFGDEKLESDDSLNFQDVFAYKPSSYQKNGINSQGSGISVDDLILNLYSQAENIPSGDSSQNAIMNGLVSTQTMLDSNLKNGDDDFDDDSWEFQDAFVDVRLKDQSSVSSLGDTHQNDSTKIKVENYVDFYCKLKDQACLVVLGHFDSLKKAKTIAALSSEEAKVVALEEEIQKAYKELQQENVVSEEVYTGNSPPDTSCLDEFFEVLHDPKFQVLESEYHLSKRLPLAGTDLRSAIELLKHATHILKLLTLASTEEQSTYVSIWYQMISVCAQELKHGASIWKQSSQKNVQSQISSEPRGQQFLVALGEIYRAVEIIGVSAKLYKLWILLSSTNSTSIFDLLEECRILWSTAGLEEALRSLSNRMAFEYDGTIEALLESIKHIHDLTARGLENHSLDRQEPFCRLTVLTQEMVPGGMKMVVWNGHHYFLTLANLWANLKSCHPPTLPHIHVG